MRTRLSKLPVEVIVEALATRGLADQALRDAVGTSGTSRQSLHESEDLRVERSVGCTAVTSPISTALGGQARVEQHQLQRAAQPEQARQEERRALGPGESGLPVGPLEARARRAR